jgi:hypothetical protein
LNDLPISRLLARAEKAEAEVERLRTVNSLLVSEHDDDLAGVPALETALRDEIMKREKAEAEVERLGKHVQNLEHGLDNEFGWRQGAEAERDAAAAERDAHYRQIVELVAERDRYKAVVDAAQEMFKQPYPGEVGALQLLKPLKDAVHAVDQQETQDNDSDEAMMLYDTQGPHQQEES